MNKKKYYLIALLLLLITTGASCNSCATKKGGGVFKTENSGETWVQKIFIQQIKRKVYTIDEYTILSMKFDPIDSSVIYIGTKGKGILVSKNAGENWEATGQKSGNIYDLDIDPVDTNIIYALNDTSIIKSSDKGATWETVHTDTKKKNFTSIVVDTYDHNKIYAASLSGIVYKSWDQGGNWEIRLQLEKDKIKKIFLRPNTRIVYALTESGDVFRTINGAEIDTTAISPDIDQNRDKDNPVNDVWKSIFTKEHKEKWPTAKSARNFFIFYAYPNAMFMSTTHGLMKSTDEGVTWSEMPTLIPLEDNENTKITNLIIDPKNMNNIYFTVADSNKIHISNDAGKNWHIIENFPSAKIINKMIINPTNPSILFTGMLIPEEKKGLIKTK